MSDIGEETDATDVEDAEAQETPSVDEATFLA
jgi:hypothetical protein